MKIDSLKTTFVEKNAPYLGAQKLNDYWTNIEDIINALKTMPIDQGSFNETGSTSSNYNLTSYRSAAPDASELPLSFIIIPTITNGLNATITASWGSTAYQIWDMTTNARIAANIIIANRPVQTIFDGTKFWVVSAASVKHATTHEPSGSDPTKFVYYGGAQTLTDSEKIQVRSNIGTDPSRLQFINTTVDNAAFVSNATYTDFPYRASVSLSGVLSTMVPHVVFGAVDAISGIFAPVAACYDGGIYLYSSEIPAADITIPTIICWR